MAQSQCKVLDNVHKVSEDLNKRLLLSVLLYALCAKRLNQVKDENGFSYAIHSHA